MSLFIQYSIGCRVDVVFAQTDGSVIPSEEALLPNGLLRHNVTGASIVIEAGAAIGDLNKVEKLLELVASKCEDLDEASKVFLSTCFEAEGNVLDHHGLKQIVFRRIKGPPQLQYCTQDEFDSELKSILEKSIRERFRRIGIELFYVVKKSFPLVKNKSSQHGTTRKKSKEYRKIP